MNRYSYDERRDDFYQCQGYKGIYSWFYDFLHDVIYREYFYVQRRNERFSVQKFEVISLILENKLYKNSKKVSV